MDGEKQEFEDLELINLLVLNQAALTKEKRALVQSGIPIRYHDACLLAIKTHHLFLCNKGITDDVLILIITFFMHYEIDLSIIDLGTNDLTFKSGKILAALLRNNDIKLTKLELNQNNLGPKGARYIAYALMENHCLSELNMAYNNLGLRGVRAITGALELNQRLNHLSLEGNRLGLKSAAKLAEILKFQHCHLTYLNISNNNFGEEGIKLIAEALKYNRSLIRLNIMWCNIHSPSVGVLADALHQNHVLFKLDLWVDVYSVDAFRIEYALLLNAARKYGCDTAAKSGFTTLHLLSQFEMHAKIQSIHERIQAKKQAGSVELLKIKPEV
jgi:Ran GTPase-activating protein (RanGAP) involved in mRNA processing and transport